MQNSLLKKPLIFAQYIPIAFVLLWATGFIGARYAMPYSEPFAFLSVRFALTLLLLISFSPFTKIKYPKGTALFYTLLTGIFIHTIYLGAVFWAIKYGLPAGFAGIIVALQPIITAFFAAFIIGDKISKMQIIGLLIGLFGISLVLIPSISSDINSNIALNAFVVFGGVVIFSLGAILQKKYADEKKLLGNMIIQYLGALAISLPLALIFEDFNFIWSGELVFAFVWLVLVLSIGAILLLMLMIKAEQATKVASYFYLVPIVTAIIAYFLFGETLTSTQIAGMFITTTGVALATILAKKIKF